MDLSGWGDLISAGGGILDSFMGNEGEEKANKLSKKQLEFMMKMATAGQEDALGNRVYYDKATNSWKVDLNPTSRATQVASDEEELARLMQDLPRERDERRLASTARGDDAAIADTLRRRIIDSSPMTPERLEGELYNAKARGIRETTDSIGRNLATQGLRTGINPGRSLDELSRTLARELGNAGSDARLEALTTSDDINTRRTSAAIDQYGAMESRARNTSNVPFNPASLSSSLGAIASGRQGALGGVASAGRNAILTQPNEAGWAQKGTSIAQLLDGIGGIFGEKKPTTGVTQKNTGDF